MIDVRTVLCPLDLTPISDRALELAVEVSKKVRARLVLEHNLDARPPGYLGVSWMWSEEHESGEEDKARAAQRRVQEMLATIPDEVPHEARLTRGPMELGLLHLARELPADLMVMGTHGASSAEHGSLTERLILQAPCPVLTLGESYEPGKVLEALGTARPETLNVLIPIDFSAGSLAAFAYGAELAERMPHHLVLVHAVKPGRQAESASEAARDKIAARVPDALASRVEVVTPIGEPASAILDLARARQAIFILMAAERRSLVKRFLFGDTTRSVLHGGACPTLFLPPGYKVPTGAREAGS